MMPVGDQGHLVRVPIGFPQEMHGWIREAAYRRHQTMAEIVREAVREYQERHGGQLSLPLAGQGGG